ncbi:hypothetical protein GALMADRAFT_243006 [Galerina marginata CBS 339.88]|uniref:Uncharacterized protein n=1 Tax=Galerina marginata (strain CBS 339.88) TaxID=685588 RepID=A0A067T7G3_GALM3|nr:hypothetical protein GALMADRAFT_243006 [Galerina marginata CBS 339.88]
MSNSSSTRKRTSPQFQTPSNAAMKETSANLPPGRKSQSMRKVSAPLSKLRLGTLIYVLIGLTALLSTYYGYRAVQYKTAVGGWWNVALGRRPPEMKAGYGDSSNTPPSHSKGKHGEGSVEYHINALAQALGMPTSDLATAIAGAVRAYVPPASLSSVKASETGEAVKVLLQKPEAGEGEPLPKPTTVGVVGSVVSGMEAVVGMDEPMQ